MISFPAPALCQGADEDLLLQIGEVVFSGCVRRDPNANGLRIWVEGEPQDPATRTGAAARFQTLLGVLRAWRPEAGELREERRMGLGEGSVCDEAGNQFLFVGSALAHSRVGGEIERLAAAARRGIEASQTLRNALWLHGRLNRAAADFYMIHEYACVEFGGPPGIRDALQLSVSSQDRLTKAANNLSPLEGGRHARQAVEARMTLDEQRTYIADFLLRWIERHES